MGWFCIFIDSVLNQLNLKQAAVGLSGISSAAPGLERNVSFISMCVNYRQMLILYAKMHI